MSPGLQTGGEVGPTSTDCCEEMCTYHIVLKAVLA